MSEDGRFLEPEAMAFCCWLARAMFCVGDEVTLPFVSAGVVMSEQTWFCGRHVSAGGRTREEVAGKDFIESLESKVMGPDNMRK